MKPSRPSSMPRFPLQVVAKSRTPEDHLKYYRWVRFVRGEIHPMDWDQTPIYRYEFGWRTRFFHFFMDLCPTVIWRHLPVRWQSAHLFGDLE